MRGQARGGVVAVMSMSRLSAGAGYRYLLKNIARGDVELGPVLQLQLTAYYAATGNPPGRWMGSGLAGLAPGELRAPGRWLRRRAPVPAPVAPEPSCPSAGRSCPGRW